MNATGLNFLLNLKYWTLYGLGGFLFMGNISFKLGFSSRLKLIYCVLAFIISIQRQSEINTPQ
jgi:hypothetical protein